MATASVTNTFVNAAVADADDVNTNFTDLVTFLNASVVHVDGSKAMSGALAMGSNKITGVAKPTANGNVARYEEVDEFITFTISDTLVAGLMTHRWYPPYAITIEDMFLSVGIAPTGSGVIIDVNKSNTTIFTTQGNRPQILAGAYADTEVSVPDVTAVATSEYLHIDVDQIGSTIAGSDLTLTIRFRKS